MKSESHKSREVQRETILDLGEDVIPDTLGSGDMRTLIEAQNRLRLLCTLAWHVFESTSVAEILHATLQAVERLTQAERCFVVALAPDGSLSVRASHATDHSADSFERTISKTIIRRVITKGQALLSSDAMTDFSSIPSVRVHRIRSIMCVPLGNSTSPSEAIYADSRADKATFTELDLRFLTALGHFVFLSMRNARVQEEIKKRCELSDERWKSLQDQLLEHRIVGSSQAMLKSYDRLRQVASTDRALLLLGPTGVGKDLFAKAAHRLSTRSSRPFVRVDVATLSEDLIESELFGHVQGAFTNAIRDKKGRFELANGGTLFLDEIGNIPMRLQAKLLRVLESGEFERVGGEEVYATDVRVISATNVDLESAIRRNEFREDLYYRIAGVTVRVPPLAERIEDVPDLVSHILTDLKSTKTFDETALRCLQSYQWPGNVRQLIRVVGEIDAICPSNVVTANDLPSHILPSGAVEAKPGFLKLREFVDQVECQHVQRALAVCDGNNNQAIELLGISREKFFKLKRRLTG